MAQIEITRGGKKHVALVAVSNGAATIELNGAGGYASFNAALENVNTLSIKTVAWNANSGSYWEVRRGGATGNIVGQFAFAGMWYLDEMATSLSANTLLNAQNVYVNLVGSGTGTLVLTMSKDATMNVPVP